MLAILRSLLSGLFGKYATSAYPAAPAATHPRGRGHVEIDIGRCIFCGICRRRCPTRVIDVSREEKTWAIEPFGCIQCNCCVEVCPQKCLSMSRQPTPVSPEMTKNIVSYARVSADPANHTDG